MIRPNYLLIQYYLKYKYIIYLNEWMGFALWGLKNNFVRKSWNINLHLLALKKLVIFMVETRNIFPWKNIDYTSTYVLQKTFLKVFKQLSKIFNTRNVALWTVKALKNHIFMCSKSRQQNILIGNITWKKKLIKFKIDVYILENGEWRIIKKVATLFVNAP